MALNIQEIFMKEKLLGKELNNGLMEKYIRETFSRGRCMAKVLLAIVIGYIEEINHMKEIFI
jgi:hypothetical protein